ncbi:EF-hand domain-containing protein [Psychrosphaera sp. F3M07]|uniref:EF-hand domain-containing protein n=1 Tax=Psychrosphaera sp. F3M07 TaxID=2841560 RepID=UPI001C09B80C|nr:EF-hand domain-containing protein [Psychrosphaera sp. F3M07]MBU2918200.1 EF-hand domain-containing protein [Psychrosphaera sp. F3M07]
MLSLKKITLVVISSLVATFFVSANQATNIQTGMGSKTDLSHLLSQLDSDNDGKLSKEEVMASKNSTLISNFSKIDANNDGSLSKKELESF